MAKYRQLHITFWQDPYIEDLEPLEKYFYIYLMTNSKTTQCGCYETSMKLIVYETGLSKNEINTFIKKFSDDKKILFDKETKEFLLINWLRHNSFLSPKVKKCIEKELSFIKNEFFKKFINDIVFLGKSIDSLSKSIKGVFSTEYTCSQQEQEQKQEEEQEEEQKIITKDWVKAVDYYKYICNQFSQPKKITDKRIGHIESRISDYGLIDVLTALETINESKFMNDSIGTTWLNFDWFWNPNNFIKIIEGNYSEKAQNVVNHPKRVKNDFHNFDQRDLSHIDLNERFR